MMQDPARGGDALDSLGPAELVLARCEAFRRNDFRFIFHSYHAEAPFLGAFSDCCDYLQYAEQVLRGAFKIIACRIVRERIVTADEAQVLFAMEVECGGAVQKTIELASIKCTEQGWRYHSGAKRPQEDFEDSLENINFEDFLNCDNLVFF
jgi:SEC-C motif-containing protein